jgi:hypothetical protein
MMAAKKQFSDYVDLAQQLQQAGGERIQIMEAMERMYNLDEPEELSKLTDAHVKKSISPDPSNAIDTGARMIGATAPTFSMPYADTENADANDTVKELASRIVSGAGKARRKPLTQTMALSSMIYGELHIRYRLVSDMIRLTKDPLRKQRLERIALVTPVLVDALLPKNCYVATDELGLTAHLLVRKMTKSEAMLLGDGSTAEEQLGDKKLTEEVTIKELYDTENHVVWIDGKSDPLLMDPLPDGIIPIQYADVEGSSFFDNDKVNRCRPFLYKVYKSKAWEQVCLMMTAGLSNLFAVSISPQLVARLQDLGRDVEVDFSNPAGVLKLMINEAITQLPLTAFTGEIQQALTMLDQKIVESTMYRTVAGESLGSGAAYSLAALLKSAGENSLIPYQGMCAHVLGSMMTDALLTLKNAGGSKKLRLAGSDKKLAEFDLNSIPDDLLLEADMKINLPTDTRQNVLMATQLTQGERPLVSYDWAREKLLDIPNSSRMDKEILAEIVADAKSKAMLQQKIQQIMTAAQSQVQPGMQQMQSGAQPGAMPQPNPQAAQPGLPMNTPMPVGQAMGESNQMPPDMMGGMNAAQPA